MKRQIEITTTLGSKKTLDAEVFGAVAVHRSLIGSGWTVTHIASGLAFWHDLGRLEAYEKARKLARIRMPKTARGVTRSKAVREAVFGERKR